MKTMKFKRAMLMLTLLVMTLSAVTGGTIAWFTDSVESVNNVIEAGNLDIEVYVGEAVEDNKIGKKEIFDKPDLWEPGAVATAKLILKNEGNLALNYQMTVSAKAENDLNGKKLSDVLKIAFVTENLTGKTREEVIAAAQGAKADTFANFKQSGSLTAEATANTAEGTLVVYWLPGANDNDYNVNNGKQTSDGKPLQITLGLNVLAVQDDVEFDSFGNDYDADVEEEITGDDVTIDENKVAHVYSAVQFMDTREGIIDGSIHAIELMQDIDLTGYEWTPIDIHADQKSGNFYMIDGNEHTISNLKIKGQAMFSRFAGKKENTIVIRDVVFNNAKVESSALNSSILTVQSYQNVLLDNVDVKNSYITGAYKVAPLIATVYNENPSTTVTATLKNCDVINTTVKATRSDFCTAGLVAFVNAGDNDKIEFENCTVDNVTLIVPEDNNKAHAFVYTTGSSGLYNEADGVTVSNCTTVVLDSNGLYKDANAKKTTYLLFDADDVIKFSEEAPSFTTGEGREVVVKLMADVDLAGKTWKPISTMWIDFDGNGHTIKNLTTEAWKAGFFGYLGGGSIKNLTLENVNVTGAQAGTFAGSVEGTIDNCFLKGTNTVTWAAKHQYDDPNAAIEAWSGIGAIAGVTQPSTVNVEIVSGTTVVLDKTGFTTKCEYVDDLTGYIGKNKGEVTNHGTVTVIGNNQ